MAISPTDPSQKRAGFTYGSLVDNRPDRGGQTHIYRTIKLKDGNEWMAENFNFLMNLNKSLGFHNTRNDPNPADRVGYGLFYNWEGIQSALPDGWRLPSINEWQNLVSLYGGGTVAYQALLMGGSSGLDLQMLNWRVGRTYTCSEFGDLGYFWSGSEGDNTKFAALLHFKKDGQKVSTIYLAKETYFTVRLIKK